MSVVQKPLNPQAPEFVPLSNASSIVQPLSTPSIHGFSLSSIVPAPPVFSTFHRVQVLHRSQRPLPLPSNIYNGPFFTNSSLPQKPTYFPILPPAPTKEYIPPHSPSSVSSPSALINPIKRGPRMATHKKSYDSKHPGERAKSGGSWLSGRGRRSSKQWVIKGSTPPPSPVHEERSTDKGRTCVKKHGILPLRSCEEKTTLMIKNIPNEYTYEYN